MFPHKGNLILYFLGLRLGISHCLSYKGFILIDNGAVYRLLHPFKIRIYDIGAALYKEGAVVCIVSCQIIVSPANRAAFPKQIPYRPKYNKALGKYQPAEAANVSSGKGIDLA